MEDSVRRAAPAEPGEEPVLCTECERPVGASARWYSDGVGGLAPYCAACAAVEFPLI